MLLEQGSSADLDHVELLDVVVPQHGGRQLGPEHRVPLVPTQHQVLCVHWNMARGHRGTSRICTAQKIVSHFLLFSKLNFFLEKKCNQFGKGKVEELNETQNWH